MTRGLFGAVVGTGSAVVFLVTPLIRVIAARRGFAMRVPGAEVGDVDHADQARVVDYEAARGPVPLCLGLAGEAQNEDDGRNEQKDAVRDPDPCN